MIGFQPPGMMNPNPSILSDPSRDRPCRVAMIVGLYHDFNLGGAERQLESLTPLLLERGIEPVIVARARTHAPNPASVAGARVVHIRTPRASRAMTVTFMFRGVRALTAVGPDVVHAFNSLSRSTMARWYGKRTGTPFVTKVLRSGTFGDLERLASKPGGRRRLRALARDAAGFTVISSEIDAELAALGVGTDRRWRIPNGVNIDRFQPVADRCEARRALGLDDNGPVVVAVGRFVPEKRLRELAMSWPLVRARHPGAQLVIAGKVVSQVDRDQVTPQPTCGVVLLGARSDMEQVYRAADLYVSPALSEGLSNALLEATASGLPSVVTAVGGAADVVDHGRSGLIVPAGDEAALAACVSDLLADPDRLAAFGRAARLKAVEGYSLDSVADRLAAMYRDVARRSVRP